MNQQQQGLYHKFNVTRTDGRDAMGEKHHGDEYFVLSLTTDPHAIPAIVAYADSCSLEFPALAADLAAKITARVNAYSQFIPVPETTLPNGQIVPTFQVAQFISSKGPAGIAQSTGQGEPWVDINYHDSVTACKNVGANLITETQALAIAWNISQQDINWTGGKVGEGDLYQGIHLGNVDKAQPGTYEPSESERRWHQLSNGERIFDFAGNTYTWVFDDVQGDENGLIAKPFAEDSASLMAPYPSMNKGMGWRPAAGYNWSGDALVRGGCWNSESYAGAFILGYGWPGDESGGVGFRCTK